MGLLSKRFLLAVGLRSHSSIFFRTGPPSEDHARLCLLVAPGVNLVVATNCAVAHAEMVAMMVSRGISVTRDKLRDEAAAVLRRYAEEGGVTYNGRQGAQP
jgi:hypothetical protein